MIEEKDGKTPETGEEPGKETLVDEESQAAKQNEEKPKSGVRLVTLALIAAVLVSGIFCARAYGRYHALKAQYRGAVREAAETLAAAEAERAEADPESETSAEERRRASEDMIQEAKAEIARIERHNGELDGAVREAEAKIKALDTIEDSEYYRAIYDEYVEGRAYVEELLAKD